MTVDVPTLRQGSLIDIRFLSQGDPQIEKNIVRESGQLLTDTPPSRPPWYDTSWGIMIILGSILVLLVGSLIVLYKYVLEPAMGPLPAPKLALALAVGLASLLPIDIGSMVQTLLLLAVLHVVTTKGVGVRP